MREVNNGRLDAVRFDDPLGTNELEPGTKNRVSPRERIRNSKSLPNSFVDGSFIRKDVSLVKVPMLERKPLLDRVPRCAQLHKARCHATCLAIIAVAQLGQHRQHNHCRVHLGGVVLVIAVRLARVRWELLVTKRYHL